MCVPYPFFFCSCIAECSLSSSTGLAFRIILRTSSIQLLIVCMATHHSSVRSLILETNPYTSISGTLYILSMLSMGTLSLHRTWSMPPSNTIWTMSKHSEYTARCIWVIGGGTYRCAIRFWFNCCTDEWSQGLLESQQPGATVLPIIVSTDKTQLMVFGRKQAYPVYMTIGNIPKEIHRKPLCSTQMLIAYIPTTKLKGIGSKASHHRTLTNLFHGCM